MWEYLNVVVVNNDPSSRSMKGWYILEINGDSVETKRGPSNLWGGKGLPGPSYLEYIRRLGQDGWEMIANPQGGSESHLVFKRFKSS